MKQKGFIPIIILVLITLLVVGYFGYKNYWPKTQNMAIPFPTPSATTLASPQPTANWKTYTNTGQNYEIKYPSNSTLEEPESYSIINGNKVNVKKTGEIRINLINAGSLTIDGGNRFGLTPKEVKKKALSSKRIGYVDTYFEENIACTNSMPVHCSYTTSYYFLSGNQIFVITLSPPDHKEIAPIFDQILSTFKFTN